MIARDWNGRNDAYGGLLTHVIDALKRSTTLAERQMRHEQHGRQSRTGAGQAASLSAARTGTSQPIVPHAQTEQQIDPVHESRP